MQDRGRHGALGEWSPLLWRVKLQHKDQVPRGGSLQPALTTAAQRAH